VILACSRRNVPGVPSASSAGLANSKVAVGLIVSTLDTWLPEYPIRAPTSACDSPRRSLAWRADLPYVRFHDLRHGAASLAKAAGASSKEISRQLGHSRQSFTDTTYVTVFPDVARAAAEAAAALVPRKRFAQDS